MVRQGADPSNQQPTDYNFDVTTDAVYEFRYGQQDQPVLTNLDVLNQATFSVNTKVVKDTPVTRTITDTDTTEIRVTVLPTMVDPAAYPKLPSGKIALNVKLDGAAVPNKSVSLRLSLIDVVVEPAIQRPETDCPARTGSAILIRSPGRTVMPAAKSVSNVTTSVSSELV